VVAAAVAVMSPLECSQCHQPKTARVACTTCKHDEQHGVFRTELLMRGDAAFPKALALSLGVFPKEDGDTQRMNACPGVSRSVRCERYSRDGARLVTRLWEKAGWKILSDTGRYA
jgi:hypothetical protein